MGSEGMGTGDLLLLVAIGILVAVAAAITPAPDAVYAVLGL